MKINHVAVLGGTFDPIHNGHLKIAEIALNSLGLDKIIFIPNNIPPHREQPVATSTQRLEMLKLAITSSHNKDNFIINTCELDRTRPSYMVDTVTELSNQYSTDTIRSIVWLILGLDSFYDLPQWHQWEKLKQLANFIVVDRRLKNGKVALKPTWVDSYLKRYSINNIKDYNNSNLVTSANNGKVIKLDIEPIRISATEIRELFKAYKKTPNNKDILDKLNSLLPPSVLDYAMNQIVPGYFS